MRGSVVSLVILNLLILFMIGAPIAVSDWYGAGRVPPETPDACTSVCLITDDCIVFGNNLDWFVDDGMLVINKRNCKKRGLWYSPAPEWISRYSSISVNQEGREFPSRGMNEKGLVIGEMTLRETRYPGPDARGALTPLQWIQYQLDMCATVEEVLATDAVIRIAPDSYPSHFFICDGKGECAAVEWIDGVLKARVGRDVPVKVMANSRYDDCVKRGDDPSGRFKKASAMLERYAGQEPVAYVFSVLEKVGQTSTVWSLVFDAKNLILHYKTKRNPSIRHIFLRRLPLIRGNDSYVLDLNGAGKGDVTAMMRPYSREFNARIVRATFRKLEPWFGPFKESDIETIIRYPEKTQYMGE
jgi:choloylglycine hydrolase